MLLRCIYLGYVHFKMVAFHYKTRENRTLIYRYYFMSASEPQYLTIMV